MAAAISTIHVNYLIGWIHAVYGKIPENKFKTFLAETVVFKNCPK